MVENKLDIAMVYNPYVYEDEFLNHIFDYKPTNEILYSSTFDGNYYLAAKETQMCFSLSSIMIQ